MYKSMFSIHSWLGLASGILILVVSLTGSLLLFADDIENWRIRDLVTIEAENGETQPDQVINNTYRHFQRGSMIKGLVMPPDNLSSYMLWVKDAADQKWKRVYVHPGSGEILGSVSQDQAFDRWLVQLHYNLTFGKWGLLLVTIIGLILIASSFTGIYVYYKMFNSFALRKIRWHRKLRIITTETHNLLGLISLPFIVLITITGLWIIIPFIPHFFESGNGGGESYEFPPAKYQVEYLTNQVKKEVPGFHLNAIWFPEHATGAIELSGHDQRQKVKARFDFNSAELLSVEGVKVETQEAAAFDFGGLIEKIHFGTYGGWIIKLLYSLLGIFPGILAISGFMAWYLKKRSKLKIKY